jgi:hypothetical protein
MCIIEMLIHPLDIRADDTFRAYCHKKTGECFYEENIATGQTGNELIKKFGIDDIELIWMDVRPCRSFKKNMTEEELKEVIPVPEAITCLLVKKFGLRLFKAIEKYPSGGKKTEYTGYGTSKYFIEYKHGKFTEWYESGQKKLEMTLEFGFKNGEAAVWYDNGTIQHKLNFLNDKLHGVVKSYYGNGALCYKDTYKHGEKINRRAYDEEGRLKFDQDY